MMSATLLVLRRPTSIIPVLMIVASGCASVATQRQESAPDTGKWILTGTRVYMSPGLPPLDDAWVYMEDGQIESVGSTASVWPSHMADTSLCSGGVIVAGFQNNHVHLPR